MRWNLQSNVGDVLALGPRTAGRLATVGIASVEHLLAAHPQTVVQRLGTGSVTAEVLTEWQREAQLLLAEPRLPAEGARLLAVAGFSCLKEVSFRTPTELLAAFEAAQQKHTTGWLVEMTLPTISDVSSWIQIAQRSKNSRAA